MLKKTCMHSLCICSFLVFALVLHQCTSVARIKVLFPYIISLHVPEKTQSFSVKVRAKMQQPSREYAGKHLHQPPQPAKGRLNGMSNMSKC